MPRRSLFFAVFVFLLGASCTDTKLTRHRADIHSGGDLAAPDAYGDRDVEPDSGSLVDTSSEIADAEAPGPLTATWRGTASATVQPEGPFAMEVVLAQHGTALAGTFDTDIGRSGTLLGAVEASIVRATLTFTDRCPGSAVTVLELDGTGDVLSGDFTAEDDCYGVYAGHAELMRQP